MRTYIILALCLSLGYVTAQGLADYVTVTAIPKSLGISGRYNKSGYDGGDPPVYENRGLDIFITSGPGCTGDGNVCIEPPGGNGGPVYVLNPTPQNGTNFPDNFNATFTLTNANDSSPAGTVLIQGPNPEARQCPKCKQVLTGPLQNVYVLESENDSRCEDGCLYSNQEDRVFCFEAGDNQVLLDCPTSPPWQYGSVLGFNPII